MKIWTAGWCKPNPGCGGWGWHGENGSRNFGGMFETTIYQMELMAILSALRALPDGTAATIYSVSQYCIKGLTVWRHGWKRKNWMKKGKPMPNRDLFLAIDEQLSRLCISFEQVFNHTRDRGGNPGIMIADSLAEGGRQTCLQ